MNWRRISGVLWLGVLGSLASPPLDSYLTQTQPRFLALHIPAWLVLGYLAGHRFRRASTVAWNPLGLTGLVFFLGSLAFWMIPRSVDAAALSPWVDQVLHANLLAAGFAFAWSVPAMPFVLRAAVGIYSASMIFSLGVLYTHYPALLCGTFTLGEQEQTGHLLLLLTAPIVIALLVSGYRALAREHTGAPPGRAAHEAGGPLTS